MILEPAKYDEPHDNFLRRVQDLCRREGAVFVLDEIIAGFRWHERGAQHVYDVTPDLSTFGKALANGFSVSALAGKAEAHRRTWRPTLRRAGTLLSTTHGAEAHSLAAAIETMRILKERRTGCETLPARGDLLRQALKRQFGAIDFGCIKSIVRTCSRSPSATDADRRTDRLCAKSACCQTIRLGVSPPHSHRISPQRCGCREDGAFIDQGHRCLRRALNGDQPVRPSVLLLVPSIENN